MENKFREFDCTVASGWEVSPCLLTIWCANTQHAPDPCLASGRHSEDALPMTSQQKTLAMVSSLLMPFSWR